MELTEESDPQALISQIAKIYEVEGVNGASQNYVNNWREFLRNKLRSPSGNILDIYNLYRLGDRDPNYFKYILSE